MIKFDLVKIHNLKEGSTIITNGERSYRSGRTRYGIIGYISESLIYIFQDEVSDSIHSKEASEKLKNSPFKRCFYINRTNKDCTLKITKKSHCQYINEKSIKRFV